ncbi:hypothetical protein [Lysobacter tyrosinilyticus]
MNKQEYVAWLRFSLLALWVFMLGWVLFAEAWAWEIAQPGWKPLRRTCMVLFFALVVGTQWIRRRSEGTLEDERDRQIAAFARFNALIVLSLAIVTLAAMLEVGDWAPRARAMPDAWISTSLVWLVGVAWMLESAIRVVCYVRDRV